MNAAKQSEPSEIELLLPWYAAGTLDARESQQVAAALAADPELASRYEWVRAELAQETHVSEAAGEPSGRDVRTLFAKIDALPAQKSRSSIDFGAGKASILANSVVTSRPDGSPAASLTRVSCASSARTHS